MSDRRLANLRAALGFLQLAPRAAELRLLHRWLDTWTGIGLITGGVERLGRLSLSHIADAEGWAVFAGHPLFAPGGYGVAPTPWGAVQRAAWAVVSQFAGLTCQPTSPRRLEAWSATYSSCTRRCSYVICWAMRPLAVYCSSGLPHGQTGAPRGRECAGSRSWRSSPFSTQRVSACACSAP
jgi:hypothetical protein